MIVRGLVVVLAVAAGCGDSGQGERLARMAEQSTHEQSAQNQRVTHAHAELAEGSKRLVDADAQARRELAQLHDKLRQDQANLGEQRNALEAERKTIATERRQDAAVGSSVVAFAILLACLAPLVLAGMALAASHRSSTQDEVSEVLIEELSQALDGEHSDAANRLPSDQRHSMRLPPPAPRR
jgi:small-conductance mechanosensitive channel